MQKEQLLFNAGGTSPLQLAVQHTGSTSIVQHLLSIAGNLKTKILLDSDSRHRSAAFHAITARNVPAFRATCTEAGLGGRDMLALCKLVSEGGRNLLHAMAVGLYDQPEVYKELVGKMRVAVGMNGGFGSLLEKRDFQGLTPADYLHQVCVPSCRMGTTVCVRRGCGRDHAILH